MARTERLAPAGEPTPTDQEALQEEGKYSGPRGHIAPGIRAGLELIERLARDRNRRFSPEDRRLLQQSATLLESLYPAELLGEHAGHALERTRLERDSAVAEAQAASGQLQDQERTIRRQADRIRAIRIAGHRATTLLAEYSSELNTAQVAQLALAGQLLQAHEWLSSADDDPDVEEVAGWLRLTALALQTTLEDDVAALQARIDRALEVEAELRNWTGTGEEEHSAHVHVRFAGARPGVEAGRRIADVLRRAGEALRAQTGPRPPATGPVIVHDHDGRTDPHEHPGSAHDSVHDEEDPAR